MLRGDSVSSSPARCLPSSEFPFPLQLRIGYCFSHDRDQCRYPHVFGFNLRGNVSRFFVNFGNKEQCVVWPNYPLARISGHMWFESQNAKDPASCCKTVTGNKAKRGLTLLFHDVDHPRSNGGLRHPAIRLIVAPEWCVVTDEIEFACSKKIHVVFMEPDKVHHRTPVRNVFHHYADGVSALCAAVLRVVFRGERRPLVCVDLRCRAEQNNSSLVLQQAPKGA